MAEGSLIEEPLWFRVTSLLVFQHQIKQFKVFHVSLELLEHSEISSGNSYFLQDVE